MVKTFRQCQQNEQSLLALKILERKKSKTHGVGISVPEFVHA